jgi:hypothetical protein
MALVLEKVTLFEARQEMNVPGLEDENTFTEDQIFEKDVTVDGGLQVAGEDVVTTDSGAQTIAGDKTFTDEVEFTDEVTGPGELVNGKYVGEIFMIPGRVKAPSADFPALCLTNIDTFTDIDAANFPNLVTKLRAETAVYLDGLTGETEDFPGNASGSVITLTDTTTNNALLDILVEHAAAFGDDDDSLGVIQWDGTDYAITDVDSFDREITVTGTPTAGAGDATFFPHRIAGSTTTARVQSWRGRSPVGANGAEGGTVSGYVRRDQFQGHYHYVRAGSGGWIQVGLFGQSGGVILTAGGDQPADNDAWQAANVKTDALTGTGPSGTPRTGSTTHSPDVATHIYMAGGIFNA